MDTPSRLPATDQRSQPSEPGSAYGKRIYLASMEMYTQFVAYRLLHDLLEIAARQAQSARDILALHRLGTACDEAMPVARVAVNLRGVARDRISRGDALLTPDGHKLAPASDALTHRVTYLEQANRYLDTVEAHQRLIAVTL